MPLSGLFACAPTADSVSERHTVADSVRASEPSRAVADTDDFGAPLPTDPRHNSKIDYQALADLLRTRGLA